MNLPNITLGTTIGNNFNSLNPLDSVFGSRAVNEKTNRIFLQTNYDVKVFGQHNFSLSLDQSKKMIFFQEIKMLQVQILFL